MTELSTRGGAQVTGRLPGVVKCRVTLIIAALVGGALLLITTRGNALLLDLAGMVGTICF